MVNPYRAEIEVKLGGQIYILRLTLNALAELEHYFQVKGLMALAQKFSAEQLKANDIIAILGAAIRGGGQPITNEEVAALSHEEGVLGFAKIITDLLVINFMQQEESDETINALQEKKPLGGEAQKRPF